MPMDGPSYLVGRADERVLTMFCSGIVLTIDACGQALSAPKKINITSNREITCVLERN